MFGASPATANVTAITDVRVIGADDHALPGIPTLQLAGATFAWSDRAPRTHTPCAHAAISPEAARQFDDPAWRARMLADPKTTDARKALAMNQCNLKTLYDAGE